MISKKDLVVISYLRGNSRETLTAISKKSRIPISTIYEQIRRSESGLITKHTCIVDFTKLGFNTRAKVVIQARMSGKQELLGFLVKNQNVNSVYKINNGYDFMIDCVFRNIRELEEFLESVQEKFKTKKMETYFIIDDIKREAFLSDPQMIDSVV